MTKQLHWKKEYIFQKKGDQDQTFVNIVRRNLIQVVKKTREKDCHIRETHTFECKVCDFNNRNKEELDTHLLTCLCPVYLQIQKTE